MNTTTKAMNWAVKNTFFNEHEIAKEAYLAGHAEALRESSSPNGVRADAQELIGNIQDAEYNKALKEYLDNGINYKANTIKNADVEDLKQLAGDSFFYGAMYAIRRYQSSPSVESGAVEFLEWTLSCNWRLNPHSKESKWRHVDEISVRNRYLDEGISTKQLYKIFKPESPSPKPTTESDETDVEELKSIEQVRGERDRATDVIYIQEDEIKELKIENEALKKAYDILRNQIVYSNKQINNYLDALTSKQKGE